MRYMMPIVHAQIHNVTYLGISIGHLVTADKRVHQRQLHVYVYVLRRLYTREKIYT